MGQLVIHVRKDKMIIDIEQCYWLENLLALVYVVYYHGKVRLSYMKTGLLYVGYFQVSGKDN